MTYNASTNPSATDKIRIFPSQVSTNMWPRLQTIISGDHQFNASVASNDGYHKVIHLINQAGTPAATSGFGQVYTKTVGTENEMFFRGGALAVELQMSGKKLDAASGYAPLPGGFLLQWGTASASNEVAISFPVAFGVAPYNIQAIEKMSTLNIREFLRVSALNPPTTTVWYPSIVDQNAAPIAGRQILWSAIGRA